MSSDYSSIVDTAFELACALTPRLVHPRTHLAHDGLSDAGQVASLHQRLRALHDPLPSTTQSTSSRKALVMSSPCDKSATWCGVVPCVPHLELPRTEDLLHGVPAVLWNIRPAAERQWL